MSLRQLADKLGLSQTTVSRALNGYPEVSAATRERVQAAAREMNYAPDARARSLATGRAMAVGHVIPEATRHELVNPIFADFIAGAGRVYAKTGYDMMLTLVADGDETETYRKMGARGRVDGIIVQVPRMNDPRIELLTEIGMPFIVHGRVHVDDADYSWLDMDNEGAFALATDKVIAQGHRKIALLNGPEEASFAILRRRGFERQMAAAGIQVNPDWVKFAPMTEDFGYAAARDILEGSDRPTAFLTASLLIANGVRRALAEARLEMGHDVSVVTHDDDLSYMPNGSPESPVFSATRVSVHEAGGLAADMLLRLISAPTEGPLQRMQETQWVDGPSLGPAPT